MAISPNPVNVNNLNYARNTVPVITVTQVSDPVTAEVWIFGDNASLFESSYQPDLQGTVRIDFSGIYEDVLKTVMPTVGDDEAQTLHRVAFLLIVSQGATTLGTYQFYVCNALYRGDELFHNYTLSHFLTNQPSEKRTDADAPEYLTWLDNSGDWTIKVRFYPKSGGHADYTLTTDQAQGVYTLYVGYKEVIKKASYLPGQLYGYYDIIAFNGKDVELMRQRYIYEERTGKEHYYMITNALGGIDTIICRGENALEADAEWKTGRFNNQNSAIDDTDSRRKWQQQTGMMPWRDRNWFYELMTVKQAACRYIPASGLQQPIVITGADLRMADGGQLASGSFNYILAEPVNAIHQGERDNSLHESIANSAEPGDDLTVQTVMEFSASQGGGYETRPITIYSDHIYVTIGGTSTVYVLIGGQVETEIDPASRMPVVVQVTSGDEVSFESQENPETITVNYYPDSEYFAQQTQSANQQTES